MLPGVHCWVCNGLAITSIRYKDKSKHTYRNSPVASLPIITNWILVAIRDYQPKVSVVTDLMVERQKYLYLIVKDECSGDLQLTVSTVNIKS